MVLNCSQKRTFTCSSEANTKLLAEQFAQIAKSGDIFALYGTLGAGKSTFSRYFIQYLTQATEVPSPTFTLVQMYDTSDFVVYHYDMYRLKHPDEAYELGIEESFYNGVNLIEWPEKIIPLLPKNIWKISITTEKNIRYFDVEVFDKDKAERLERIAYA